jgi:hypothetical protein
MRFFANSVLVLFTILATSNAEGWASESEPPGQAVLARWSFDVRDGSRVEDDSGRGHHGTLVGDAKPIAGVRGLSLQLDGWRDHVVVPDNEAFDFPEAVFSVMAWVNVYALDRGQQMIVAKNVYSADQREWGLMLDHDNRFRFYLQHNGWQTVASGTVPRPGHWYHVAVTVDAGHGRLFVNGRLEGEGKLGPTVSRSAAPLTIGGVNDGGRLRQMWHGVLDDVGVYAAVVCPEDIRKIANLETIPHEIPGPLAPYLLWQNGKLPNSDDIPVLEGVEFSVIKPHEHAVDGGNWLLGVGLAWHKGKLYASYGFNTGSENTATEEAHVRVSQDGGRTWGDPVAIDAGEGNLGVSHGVFLSHKGRLWAFQGAFYDHFQRTHTRAYTLDEATGAWEPQGVVVSQGFWPMQEPLKMADGNWIMAGARVTFGYEGLEGHLPAVALSHGDDFTKWDLVVIPADPRIAARIWGESTVSLIGTRILNISRWGGQAMALASVSEDFGRRWTPARASNLAMATSKPYTGTLSTGQHYLICTTTADSGGRRSPLTIAVSRPGEEAFSRVFVIRHAVFPEGPGPSSPKATLCYPYAVEHEGKLYVGYAVKSHRTAELAVIPVDALEIEEGPAQDRTLR